MSLATLMKYIRICAMLLTRETFLFPFYVYYYKMKNKNVNCEAAHYKLY